jgi:hypothetical protein
VEDERKGDKRRGQARHTSIDEDRRIQDKRKELKCVVLVEKITQVIRGIIYT